MGRTYAGKKQTQVVVYFCNRGYRGTRIAAGRFLVYRYRRRQTIYLIYFWLFHQTQKLPGIRTQAFYITTLAFRVNSIKRQRRFTGTRQPGYYYQLVARKLNANI